MCGWPSKKLKFCMMVSSPEFHTCPDHYSFLPFLDLKDIRDKAEAEIKAELEVLKQAHTNALSEAMKALSPRSLRRKRSALDAEDGGDDTDCALGESAPPPKRARRIATTVVQTTTAVTLGAAAAWGLLAFS